MNFELMPEGQESGPDWRTEDDYCEPCENLVEIGEDDEFGREPDEDGMGYCGGRVRYISEHHYYNGMYDCITLTLECEHCGLYDVECV